MTQLPNITHNVHEHCGDRVHRVQGDIDRDIHAYLFNNVLAYKHKSVQAIVNFFFQRLYEECLAQGIPRVWDEAFGEKKVLEILNKLNFNEQQPAITTPTDGASKRTRKRPARV